MIQSADITTIDSFCLNIVKEYFSYLNLDPAVGIGDPGMLEMLKYDVMTELFKEKMRSCRNRAIRNLVGCWKCSVMENGTTI